MKKESSEIKPHKAFGIIYDGTPESAEELLTELKLVYLARNNIDGRLIYRSGNGKEIKAHPGYFCTRYNAWRIK